MEWIIISHFGCALKINPSAILQNGDEVIQGTPDLLGHATAFYKNLFGPQLSACTRLRDDIWSVDEKLSDLERVNLDIAFTEEEIKM
jgi:hypothetical protein